MTIFEDLRAEYKVARESALDYQRNSALFAQRLARRFQNYIGAPENYLGLNRRDTGHYIEPMKVTITGPANFTPEEPQGLTDLISKDDDGYWLVGLRLTLDVADNTFPKDKFVFLLRFVVRDDECEMSVGFDKRSFKFQLNDDEESSPYSTT